MAKGFIHSLFEILNREKISYLVLRNYENLPEKPLEGSDIDILISERYLKSYENIFKKIVKEQGVFVISKKTHFNCLSYFVYQKEPSLFSNWIDAFTRIATKGFVWAETDFLLKKRIFHEKGFFVLPPGAESAILFLKEILAGYPVKERYRQRIQELIKKDKLTFIQTISAHFNPKIVQEICFLAENGKWEEAFKKRKKWWRNLVLNNFLKHPVEQIFDFLKFFLGYLKERFHFQKGVSVAFIGPDGAGKTTISQGVGKRLANLPQKKVCYYHGRFGFFPELSKIYNFLSPKTKISSHPTKESFLNKLRAILHLFYYGLEFFLSWPLFLLGKIRGKIFLFDRYFYDYIATSIHRQIPPWLFSFISKLIPNPDLTFIIYARPEEIYKRKKEWPIEEIRKQLEFFQSLRLLKLTNCFLIDSEKPLEINLDKIEDEILNFLKI